MDWLHITLWLFGSLMFINEQKEGWNDRTTILVGMTWPIVVVIWIAWFLLHHVKKVFK